MRDSAKSYTFSWKVGGSTLNAPHADSGAHQAALREGAPADSRTGTLDQVDLLWAWRGQGEKLEVVGRRKRINPIYQLKRGARVGLWQVGFPICKRGSRWPGISLSVRTSQ